MKQKNPSLRILLIPLDTSQQAPLRRQPVEIWLWITLCGKAWEADTPGSWEGEGQPHPFRASPQSLFLRTPQESLTLAVIVPNNALGTPDGTSTCQGATGAPHSILVASLCAAGLLCDQSLGETSSSPILPAAPAARGISSRPMESRSMGPAMGQINRQGPQHARVLQDAPETTLTAAFAGLVSSTGINPHT